MVNDNKKWESPSSLSSYKHLKIRLNVEVKVSN